MKMIFKSDGKCTGKTVFLRMKNSTQNKEHMLIIKHSHCHCNSLKSHIWNSWRIHIKLSSYPQTWVLKTIIPSLKTEEFYIKRLILYCDFIFFISLKLVFIDHAYFLPHSHFKVCWQIHKKTCLMKNIHLQFSVNDFKLSSMCGYVSKDLENAR